MTIIVMIMVNAVVRTMKVIDGQVLNVMFVQMDMYFRKIQDLMECAKVITSTFVLISNFMVAVRYLKSIQPLFIRV